MDLTYKQDHMYIDGEAVNIPNAAAVYDAGQQPCFDSK